MSQRRAKKILRRWSCWRRRRSASWMLDKLAQAENVNARARHPRWANWAKDPAQ